MSFSEMCLCTDLEAAAAFPQGNGQQKHFGFQMRLTCSNTSSSQRLMGNSSFVASLEGRKGFFWEERK